MSRRISVVLMALMMSAAFASRWMTPNIRIVDQKGKPDFEAIVPYTFGPWRIDPNQPIAILNPVQEENINRIYDQTLSRTYIGPENYRVMLSIAYGVDQRSGVALSVHYPEVCYPAQGFEVRSNVLGSIHTDHATLPVRRIETAQGNGRREPVTYWIILGKYVTLGGLNRRLVELKYGLAREIPDGLLFRVSSVDNDSARAFKMQERFIADLLRDLPAKSRERLAGLPHP